MVFKKTTNHGSNGFNVPNIPRAPRSCRRKSQFKRTVDDSRFCAFELLASLAGKLLQESESSSTSTNALERNNQSDVGKEVKQEQDDECKPLEAEYTDSKSTNENTTGKCILNEFPVFEHDDILERTPISGSFGNMNQDLNSIESEKQKGSNLSLKTVGGSTGESYGVLVNNGLKQPEEKPEGILNADLAAATTRHSEDATDLHINFTNLPTYRVPVPNSSFARNRNHIKLGCRDDDDKFYRFYACSKKSKSYRHPTSVREWRLKKLLSNNWKAAPQLKDFEYSRPDGGHKQVYRKRKTSYGYQHRRHQFDSVFKRRKISDSSSIVTSDGGFSSESVSNSPEKGNAVKFSIKSFKVPELYIDVPETATVGSLKRTVLEAVTALLGGELRVGLRVRGKKVRDDKQTLIQTGISCKENLDTLGFTLEPGPEKPSPTVCTESDDPPSLPSDATKVPKCSPVSPFLGSGIPSSDPDSLSSINAADNVDSNRQLVAYKTEISTNEPSDSKALVPVPALNIKALAMIPINQKAKRSELAQRRTRRPFSVPEVEALVQAVEDVGTGRWRDVKLRAFENADHRTYVDLKDKWKTLVHTASIAPQQRRGAPVPQPLLDRVLAAHSYWTQHQAKQQDKHQNGSEHANRVGATSIQAV